MRRIVNQLSVTWPDAKLLVIKIPVIITNDQKTLINAAKIDTMSVNLFDEGVANLLVRERPSNPVWRGHDSLLIIVVFTLAKRLAGGGGLVWAAIGSCLAVCRSWWCSLVDAWLRLWWIVGWIRSLLFVCRLWAGIHWIWRIRIRCNICGLSTVASWNDINCIMLHHLSCS